MIRFSLIIFLLAFSSGLCAASNGDASQVPGNQDTVKTVKPIRRKGSKQDSVKMPRILKEWTLSHDYSEEIPIPIDTVFSLSNRFKRVDIYSPVNASLGNYGLPFYQLNFFDRVTDRDKYLYKYYYPLMHTSTNPLFMNTQVPYTELDWSYAGPTELSEQTFRVRHSQNVNRFLNFGVIYDIVFSLGQYNFQRSADKTFTFYSSYTGPKYKLYFSAGINNLHSFENGGITNAADLSLSDTRAILTNLTTLDLANSFVKNRSILLVQRYAFTSDQKIRNDSTPNIKSGFFGLTGTFSHILTIDRDWRTYQDAYPISGYYRDIFISLTSTRDSVYSRSIKNTVRFDFTTDESRKFRLGGGAGIRNELSLYSYIFPIPIPFNGINVESHRNSNILLGRLFNNIGDKFRWLATGEIYVTGYRLGDFSLNGEISKSFDWKKGRASWLINGAVNNTQPSIWYEHWGGNNFAWNTNLKKEFRIDLGSTFKYPARHTELRFNYAIIKNYTDFGTDTLPSQYSGGLSVVSVAVKNELRAWKFHLATDLIVQKSSNTEILDLPLATVRSAAYFEHLFRFVRTGGRLNTQLGADVTYNTMYHPYSYMPAIGVFYRQDSYRAGNYPYLNAFINLKIKRTRFFILLDHINAGLMGKNYFMVPNYPMNIRMFRYGLSWTFYD